MKTNIIQTLEEYRNNYFAKGGNIPPCIKNILIPPNEFNYDSFLYKIQNNKNNKVYIGVHKGEPLVNYFHSSEDPEFLKDLNEKNADFSFEVKEWGDYDSILKKEKNILQKNNAKNSHLYYNKNNGIAKPMEHLDVLKMKAMAFEINNEKKLTYKDITIERVKLNKNCLKNFARLQIRFRSIDTDHKNVLKNKVSDLGGNTEHLTVVVLDYNDVNIKKKIIGGIHSSQAIMECKSAVDVHILFIPEEIHKDLSEIEIKTLASFLNKRPKEDYLPNTKEDLVEMALEYLKKGYTQASPEMKDLLMSNELDSKTRKNILQTAVRKFKASQNPINWINYKSGQDHTNLEAQISLYNDLDKGMYCNAVSSGSAKNVLVEYRYVVNYNNQILNQIKKKKFDKKLISNFKIIIYHPTPEDQKKWENGLASENRLAIDYGLAGFESKHNHKINFSIDYMPTTQSVPQVKQN